MPCPNWESVSTEVRHTVVVHVKNGLVVSCPL